MNKLLTIFALALTSFVAACGGSASDQKAQPQIVVLGNSISVYQVDPVHNWTHVSGMAASDAAHDYAHLVAKGLNQPLSVTNIAQMEVDPINEGFVVEAEVKPTITGQTTVIIQLGDEVAADPYKRQAFKDEYTRLITSVSARKTLICVGTWTSDADLDAAMSKSCTDNGGRFVSIGDLYAVRADVIQPGEDQATASRPHDPSMALIAQRILGVAG